MKPAFHPGKLEKRLETSFLRMKLYYFEDRGNHRVPLRPELTLSLARLVIQKGKLVSLPLKWYAVGQCWHYEGMNMGRQREHYQWNVDIIGVPNGALLKQRGLLPELGLQIETLSAHWIGISRAKLLQLLLISGKKVKVLTWFWKINPLNVFKRSP
ncbi:histidine--tRNA ligase, chloroplastic mitochondrial [Olea europaea subsp. europaea]|uniref:histidine--tRNA ligase n=1 Tax=Olea europaea subsp. europaea TaxID=158383 RepID=A0A8S0VBN8_OLEEU|nr:histidine--tRNA ligase, chloroplastic mitochondrial [Olea europaea subsp. europaea]